MVDLCKDHIDVLWLYELINCKMIDNVLWDELIDYNTRLWSSKEIKLVLMRNKQARITYMNFVIMYNNTRIMYYSGTTITLQPGFIKSIISSFGKIHIKNSYIDIIYDPSNVHKKHIIYLKEPTTINLDIVGRLFVEYVSLHPLQEKLFLTL